MAELQLQCCTTAILTAILEFVIQFVSNSYRLCPVLFRTSEIHKRGIYTQTHTYDDSIRRNAMRCISPKNQWNGVRDIRWFIFFHETHFPPERTKLCDILQHFSSDYSTDLYPIFTKMCALCLTALTLVIDVHL